MKRKSIRIIERLRMDPRTSHGEGRWFNPSRSNHSESLKPLQNRGDSAPFRGLPESTLPYRSLLKTDQVRPTGSKRGVNGPSLKQATIRRARTD